MLFPYEIFLIRGVFFCIQTELFGGDIASLVSNENSVPPLVDKLIQDIESRGEAIA